VRKHNDNDTITIAEFKKKGPGSLGPFIFLYILFAQVHVMNLTPVASRLPLSLVKEMGQRGEGEVAINQSFESFIL
jgi:hypothetical protein